MRKYSAGAGDPYLDAATGILRNLVGATTADRLEVLEGALVAARTYELALDPAPGGFDLAHLRRIHRHLFQDVYDWAGDLRRVEIRKGRTVFARYEAIEPAANDLFGRLAHEDHLRDLDRARFSARAGYFLGEINVLHPFRDGNGRAQRAFISQLAEAAGFRIDWAGMTREAVVRASIAAYDGDPARLAMLIAANLSGSVG